ncbi:MAG: hypothetical protein WCG81_15750 [Candidatus Angelobacter sp.]
MKILEQGRSGGGSALQFSLEFLGTSGNRLNIVHLLAVDRGASVADGIAWQHLLQGPLNTIGRVIDELKLDCVQARAFLPSQKLDHLQCIPDVVVELGDGFHTLSYQISTGFCFPCHLPEQTASEQSGKAIAKDDHVKAGKPFFYQQPVENNANQRNNQDDQQRDQAAMARPQRFNRKFLFCHSKLILKQSGGVNRSSVSP